MWKMLLLITVILAGCQVCQEYDATVIKYGELIVSYNKGYIAKDETLSSEEKAIMLDACNEYLKLLKQE